MQSLTLKRKTRGRTTFQYIPGRAAQARSIPLQLCSTPSGGLWSTRHYLLHQLFLYLKSESHNHGAPFPPGCMSSSSSLLSRLSWLVKHLRLVHYSPTETFYFPVPKYFHGNALATRASILKATYIYSGDSDPSCAHQLLNA